MTDMDKMTMRDYAKRCGVTYECVRRTVNKELKITLCLKNMYINWAELHTLIVAQ